nr:small multi-drug export protein [Methanolinea mesophila]
MLAYLIPPAGKESVIPLGIALGLPWYLVATSVAMLDIAAALFMAWNFDLALNIPVLGPWIGKFMHHGQEFVRQRPWLERLYFTGLALFVMFPLQGSGGIGASIVGRILGMPKHEVVAAIAIGAFAGSFLLALGFEFLKDILLANIWVGIAVIVAVLAGVLVGYLYLSRRGRKNREKLR